jgi:hypothetical protein
VPLSKANSTAQSSSAWWERSARVVRLNGTYPELLGAPVIGTVTAFKGQLAVRFTYGLLHEMIKVFRDDVYHFEVLDG